MFPELTISGTAFERGHQHGRNAARQVRHSIRSYARLFAYWRGMDWAAVQDAAAPYADAIGAFDAELLDEIHGIAAGANCDVNTILALNARTELIAGTARVIHPNAEHALASNRAAGLPDYSECTAVAVLPAAAADGTTRLAQNWDWNGEQRAACVLLHIHAPGRPTVLTLTEAGIVGKIGLNEVGVGVCLNILSSPDDGKNVGVPVHVLLRGVMNTTSVAEARALIERVQVGGSSNMLCADAAGHAASIEVTPRANAVVEPENGLLIHTNHCIGTATCAATTDVVLSPSTVPRYDRAGALLQPQRGRIDRDAIIAMLRDERDGMNAICRHPDLRELPVNQVETVAAVVMELAERRMFVAPNVPSKVDFAAVNLSQ